MNPLDLALENHSLRVQRDTGYPLVFTSGTNEDGSGWCASTFRGLPMDNAWADSGSDEAKRLLLRAPIQREVYQALRAIKGERI